MTYNRVQRYFQSESNQSPPLPEGTKAGFIAVSISEMPTHIRSAMQDNRGLYEWAYRQAQEQAAAAWDADWGFSDYSI